MKKPPVILAVILCLGSLLLFSQNAPVTRVKSMVNPPVGSAITIPVNVSSFKDIGSISLVLEYDPAVLSYIGAVPNPALNSMLLNGTNTPGRIVVSWYSLSGLSLIDGSSIFDLAFKYLGGTTGLNWYTVNQSCEYTKFNSGAYTILNDQPLGNYYVNGAVTGNPAPVTIAPMITGAAAGSLAVPVVVNRFNDIGTVSLTLEYDPAVLVFQDQYTGNPELLAAGTMLAGSQDAPGGKKYIRVSWVKSALPPAPPVNLPDNSTLITLMFNFPDPLLSTELKWIDDLSSGEYTDGSFNVLWDYPVSEFFINGVVTGSQPGPVITVPYVGANQGMDVTFPLNITGFNNIGSFHLRLDYDPAVMTFISAALSGSMPSWTFTSSTPVAGQLVLSGNGTGTSLTDGSFLCRLTFHFQGATSNLNWYDADNISGIFTDGSTGLPLFDQPQAAHYIDGSIVSCICP